MPVLVLVHSPLVGPSTWMRLAPELERLGLGVVVPSLAPAARGRGPYAPAFAAAVRDAAPGGEPLVLVAHSGAGMFVPAITGALDHVAACIFVDATLPRDRARWIDTYDANARASDAFREAATRGVVPNPWRSPSPWRQVGIGDEALVARLAAEAIEPPFALFEEPITLPPGWPAFPVGYLAFVPNPFYAPVVEHARTAGFRVREMPGSHFEMLVRPEAVAEELVTMVSALTS